MDSYIPIWVPQRKIADTFLRPLVDNPQDETLFDAIARIVDSENPHSLMGLSTDVMYSQYINENSGLKWCSPYVNRMFNIWGPDSDDTRLSYYGQLIIAQDIAIRYADIWEKRRAAYEANYGILDTYNMRIDGEKVDDGTNELTHGHTISGTNTTTYGRTASTTGSDTYGHTINSTGSSDNYSFGFNTNDQTPVPQAKGVNGEETTHGGSDSSSSSTTNSGTDSTANTINNRGTDTTKVDNTNTYHETRTGRMSWHTPQDLIKQELELWQKDLMSTIFKDIDSVLALKAY